MRYIATIKDVYGEENYRQHIREGLIFVAEYDMDHEVNRTINNGVYAKLIKITRVTKNYVAYVLCDYPELGERTFGWNSIMAENLIEMKFKAYR